MRHLSITERKMTTTATTKYETMSFAGAIEVCRYGISPLLACGNALIGGGDCYWLHLMDPCKVHPHGGCLFSELLADLSLMPAFTWSVWLATGHLRTIPGPIRMTTRNESPIITMLK